MRLVSFVCKEAPQELRWGIWKPEDDAIFDVCRADASLPVSLRMAVEEGDALYERLQKLRQQHGDNAAYCVAQGQYALRAPYTNPPRNILCTGINYVEHLHELVRPLEVEQKLPEFPFIFTKPCTAIAHPYASIDGHASETEKYDYEVELAVIIGKQGKDIPMEEALSYVFGYSIINDLSARDLQRRTSQWYVGKSLDESAPFGPCIVCRQALADPQNLHLQSRINGEVRQNSHTSHMIFSVAKLIHILSQGSTLLPGDIIATGTPAGVGMSFDPPKMLKKGDVMALEIEHIGVLENTIK